MTCPEFCACHTEGDRGLRGDGTGTAGDPFVVLPDDGYTIPYTVPGPGLPGAGALDVGWLVWQRDIHRLAVFNTTGWEIVAPEWRATYPNPFTLSAIAGTWEPSDKSINIGSGAWLITGVANVFGSVDPLDPGDPSFPTPGNSVTYVQPVTAALYDVGANATIGYDQTLYTPNRTTFVDSGGGVLNPGAQFVLPYTFVTVVVIPPASGMDISMRFRRGKPGDPFILDGSYDADAVEVRALRMAEYDFTT